MLYVYFLVEDKDRRTPNKIWALCSIKKMDYVVILMKHKFTLELRQYQASFEQMLLRVNSHTEVDRDIKFYFHFARVNYFFLYNL